MGRANNIKFGVGAAWWYLIKIHNFFQFFGYLKHFWIFQLFKYFGVKLILYILYFRNFIYKKINI